jgi:hypothetical protein
MTAKVETFECQETISETVEQSEEAVKLINELDLEGQQTYVKPTDENDFVTRMPYRLIKADEKLVYQTLCPKETRLEQFEDCPIPLRVLQIISHAKQFDTLKAFWIWSAQGEIKDPVLLAATEDKNYRSGQTYILARWADELDSFEALKQKALKLLKASYRTKIEQAIERATFDKVHILPNATLATFINNPSASYYGLH